MEIEKYSPKWLLEKINASKTDAHKLMHIIEYRKEIVESTEKQFAIHSVVVPKGTLCRNCGSDDIYNCFLTDVKVCNKCHYQD